MPTLLELSGLALPEGAQGQSLRPFFEDPMHSWDRPAITELPLNLRGHLMTSLIHENWKLIQMGGPDSDECELNDQRQDPLNQVNLAHDNPVVVAQLASRLDEWRGTAIVARLDDEEAAATMDADEFDRLRALGYVQ